MAVTILKIGETFYATTASRYYVYGGAYGKFTCEGAAQGQFTEQLFISTVANGAAQGQFGEHLVFPGSGISNREAQGQFSESVRKNFVANSYFAKGQFSEEVKKIRIKNITETFYGQAHKQNDALISAIEQANGQFSEEMFVGYVNNQGIANGQFSEEVTLIGGHYDQAPTWTKVSPHSPLNGWTKLTPGVR